MLKKTKCRRLKNGFIFRNNNKIKIKYIHFKIIFLYYFTDSLLLIQYSDKDNDL